MLKTILFDLDGTLLPFKMEDFIQKYFEGLGRKFKDYFTFKELQNLLWESTNYMIKNMETDKTNADAFFEDFYSKTNHSPNQLNPLFEEFYTHDFPKIKEVTKQSQDIIKSISLLKEKNYELVVATNPLFPKQAILHRVEWAGLNKADFAFITNFEEMHFCKPHLHFYQELLEKINRQPQECMMVGNDVEEDMVAKKLGCATYLIEDYKIQRSQKVDTIDHVGKYEDFYEFVKALPPIK
ncbi:HAD superfamily hydrolase [Clostridium aceticum]|uniref:HAD superfamily hydrolase n=1 Tax=Clostridium aceticum TaxID=84022 RepID=A0A0D8IH66_9CLOT|nr:HAD family hydrolase [Clostridium aceticum]AKL94129.1 HAD superfamily hydrolase [Clostridium aceticum]KJF28521.1 hydrolase [Clostridium aceticum]